MKKSLLFILLAVVVFSSCNYMENLQVEKRHYRNGYYVHHSGKAGENKTVAAVNETAAVENENIAAVKPEALQEEMQPVAETHIAILPVKENPSAAHKTIEAAPVKKEKPQKADHVIAKLKQGAKPKQNPAADDVSTNELIMIILAIFISPLAVYLKEGVTNRFWIDLVCWLLGGGLVFSPFFYGGGLLLFAIVFAVLIVFDVI